MVNKLRAWLRVKKIRREFAKPEFHRMLGVSTAHLNAATLSAHDLKAGHELCVYEKREVTTGEHYGWFLSIMDIDPEDSNLPEDLLAVIRFAQKLGAEWVMFDDDAKLYDELPKYVN